MDFDQEAHTYAVFDATIAQLNEAESGKEQEQHREESASEQTEQTCPSDPAVQIPETTIEANLKQTALPRVVETELMGTA